MRLDWQRVRSVFEAVCDVDEPQRQALLDRTCAGAAEIRAEVESLLRHSAGAPSFLEAPAVAALSDSPLLDPHALIGQTCGSHRIDALIDAGGMGMVYRGTRHDVPAAPPVAVKVIKAGMVTRRCLQRFEAERHMLARLEHPHIARWIDAGVTSGGLPYLVMEYVDGVDLTTYCRRLDLDLGARLRLFHRVCLAVAYAHGRLIVHRDLKPANILVTPDGSPRLLDFGVARMLDDGDDRARTTTGGRFMTLDYASPEQLRGESVGTATDIYSLGVVLYELLAGRKPHDQSSRSWFEAQEAICNKPPLRPSAVAGASAAGPAVPAEPSRNPLDPPPTRRRPPRLRRRLAGDLDAIVMKAMRPEPEQRYASVEQLAGDIQRHLDGLPVSARTGTLRYRAAKFLRRHTVPALAVGGVLISLTAGLVGTLWQARAAAAQRDRAVVEAGKVRRVLAFLEDMLASADPRQEGPQATIGAVLDAAASRVERDLGSDALASADIRDVIGYSYHTLGRYDDALAQLEAALTLRRAHLAPGAADLGESLQHLGHLQMSRGQFTEAGDLLAEALEIRRALAPTHPLDLAETLSTFGNLALHRRDVQRAAALHEEALALRREVQGPDHRDVANSLINLASAHHVARRFEHAEPLYREALDVLMADPDIGEQHSDVSDVYNNLGSLMKAMGRFEEAEQDLRRALVIREAVLGPEHPNVARTASNLGDLLSEHGEAQEAQDLLEQALAIRRRRLPPQHPDLAKALQRLALHHLRHDTAGEAVPLLAEAVAIHEASPPPGRAYVREVRRDYARCLAAVARYDEAEAQWLACHDELAAMEAPPAAERDAVVRGLIDLYRDWGRPRQRDHWLSVLGAASADQGGEP